MRSTSGGKQPPQRQTRERRPRDSAGQQRESERKAANSTSRRSRRSRRGHKPRARRATGQVRTPEAGAKPRTRAKSAEQRADRDRDNAPQSVRKRSSAHSPRRRSAVSPRKQSASSRARQGATAAKEWYGEALAKGVHGVVGEFRALRRYLPAAMATSAYCGAGSGKNRYKDVLCEDKTRVHLHNEPMAGGETSDYMHGNWVDGSRMPRQFICTQGPTEASAADFWRMVYQSRAPLILMLCEPVEKNKNKCYQYWPVDKGEKARFGAYTVVNMGGRLERVSSKSQCRIVNIKLTASYNKEPWQVFHAHWTDWPDRGVPPDSKSMLVLRDKMSCHGHPVIVHCSAGIGRTGTYVAVDLLVGALERGDAAKLDVVQCIKHIRDQRLHSVQNEQQYVFIYRVLVDYITVAFKLDAKNPALMAFWSAHESLMKGCAM